MAKTAYLKFISIICAAGLVFSGCANTIPLRTKNAVPIHPSALYPVRAAVIAFSDARPLEQKEKAKKRSWPGWTGRLDYYGEDVGRGLSAHMADYLTASNVFISAENMEFLQSDTALKSLGYKASLTGKITSLNAALEVPKWVLVLAVIPNPLFLILPGITLVPLVVWPKKMEFHIILEDLKLKNLESGEVYSLPNIEIREEYKKFSRHIFAKWYLGELAEKATKQLINGFRQKDIRF